jgi:pilus assembly protein CpaE
MARSQFDYVLVDLDAPYPATQSQALLQSDIVLLVMRLDFASVRQTQQLLAYLEEIELDRTRIQLVVSRYGRPRELKAGDVEKTLGIKAHCFVPDDAGNVIRANNRGIPVVLDSPRAAVSRTLLNLSHAVNGKRRN